MSLSQTYAKELQKAPNPHHKVIGGFHLNPKGVELALRVRALEYRVLTFTVLQEKKTRPVAVSHYEYAYWQYDLLKFTEIY